jgi:exosortase
MIDERNPARPAASGWMKWAIVLLPLGFLWFTLINQLSVEWSVNPEYSYGWVVPLLCVGLLIRRWQAARDCGTTGLQDYGLAVSGPWSRGQWSTVALFATLAFLYLPTRLIQEANPEWRLISWALAFEVLGLTLLFLRPVLGRAGFRRSAFPICFLLVAVPWPSFFEWPLIQSLTRINSAAVVELLGWLGIPAVQHANLIEVSTGTVGVDEACSGIRSFQTSLMISVFFGEFYRMGLWRRLLLIPAGFILAMAFNVCRMLFLTIVAAKKGIAAIAAYHDPAGISITLACTAGLWGLAVIFSKKLKTETLKAGIGKQGSEVGGQRSAVSSPLSSGQTSAARVQGPEASGPMSEVRPLTSGVFRLGLALLVWLVAVEVGVESWYRWHEARLPQSVVWSIDWARDNPKFVVQPIAARTKELLRYDEGSSLAWREDDGTQWQLFYFHWLPGRSAPYLANFHTPEVCLGGSGDTLHINPGLDYLRIHGLLLPFRAYSIDAPVGPGFVFYCRWEDRALEQGFEVTTITNGYTYSYGNRLDFVLKNRRSVGQRTLEILVRGIDDEKDAEDAVLHQLEKLIKIEKPEEKLKS